jgi:hypothetical protein
VVNFSAKCTGAPAAAADFYAIAAARGFVFLTRFPYVNRCRARIKSGAGLRSKTL